MGKIKNSRLLGAYLDGAANTPLDPRVYKAMKPYLKGFCGNSNSTHRYGQVADQAIDSARGVMAEIFGCNKEEILFTSGATESNNWVIKEMALEELEKPEEERKMRIICLKHEHSSVISPCESLKRLGFEIEYVDPNAEATPLLSFKKAMLKKNKAPLLVCCMAVNNETGAEMPAEAVAKFALQMYKTPTLVDCTQALSEGGRDALDLRKRFPHAAFMTFSGHKIYGPTGIGCLIVDDWILKQTKHFRPSPLLSGGSQEFGYRGGTSNTAAIVGLAEAVRLMASESYSTQFKRLRTCLCAGLDSLNKWVSDNATRLGVMCDSANKIHLNEKRGVSHIININCGDFLDLPNLADALASYGIAVSAGAACAVDGNGTELSHVLKAMKLDDRGIQNSIRVSFTKYTTRRELDALIKALFLLIKNGLSPRPRLKPKVYRKAKKQPNTIKPEVK